MSQLVIKCRRCGESQAVELSEALAAPTLEAERRKGEEAATERFAAERRVFEEAAAKTRAEGEETIADLRRALASQNLEVAKAKEVELAALKAIQKAEAAERNIELEISRRASAEAQAASARAREQTTNEFQAKVRAIESMLAETDQKLKAAEGAERAALKRVREAEEAERNVDLTVARRVAAEIDVVVAEARKEIAAQFSARLEATEAALAETENKRRTAEDAELAARKATREAEDAMRATELTVARRLDDERVKIRDQAFRERDEEYRLRLGDKDKQLADLRAQLEEMQRRAEQGSPQLVGEVLEVDLVDVLSSANPTDRFERTGKGQSGGDVKQFVIGSSGIVAGIILWEAKRTKNWSDAWLPKIREDQRNAKADVAAIATESLPDGVAHFDCVDGVWVTGFSTIAPLAAALRQGLIEAARARRAAASADQKKDVVYDYLTGSEFRRRVIGVLEPIAELRSGLDAEQRSMTRQWSQRGKQIERMIGGIAGVYGDLQGILGANLPQIEGLALPPLATDGAERYRLNAGDPETVEV